MSSDGSQQEGFSYVALEEGSNQRQGQVNVEVDDQATKHACDGDLSKDPTDEPKQTGFSYVTMEKGNSQGQDQAKIEAEIDDPATEQACDKISTTKEPTHHTTRVNETKNTSETNRSEKLTLKEHKEIPDAVIPVPKSGGSVQPKSISAVVICLAFIVYWWCFTTAYGISLDLDCDTPVRSYYWITTLGLLLTILNAMFCRQRTADDSTESSTNCLSIITNFIGNIGFYVGATSLLGFPDETCPELFEAGRNYLLLSLILTAIYWVLGCLAGCTVMGDTSL